MTIEDTVNLFLEKTIGAKGGKPTDFFCGMTNNPDRRKKEHGASEILARTKCADKDCARNLMWKLMDADFDVDKDVMSGQDDSIYVYVYRKTSTTIQKLTRTVTIDFQTTWYSEDYLDQLPDKKGIYCCFSCDDKTVNGKFQNSKPIYIGMTADSFKKRINDHKNKDHDNWKNHLPKGKQLVYAIAEYDEDILQAVEAALICKNRPTENTEYTEGYQGEYHSVTVNCTGAYRGLQSCVTATFVGIAK